MSKTTLFPISFDNLSAKERHNYILNKYAISTTAESQSRKHKRDIDVIRENHRFLWDEQDVDLDTLNWEQRLVLRYYRKLFKEYCIADLSRYKENKIALRWRTEHEVVTGLGQFQCGSRHCGERDNLRSWEVNFKYIEQGSSQNALVKLRLCPVHTEQLNYRTKKREFKRQIRRETKVRKAKRSVKRPKLNENVDSIEEQPQQSSDAVINTEVEDSSEEKEVQLADEHVWSKQLDITKEQPSREQEFERYLEDLLL